jgi:Holliday junction resolvase RusA-like endonuclease
MGLLFKCFIPGRPVSKKNTKKFVRRHGHVMVIYSKKFKDWESTAIPYIRQAFVGKQTIACHLEIRLVFHFKNHAHEADVSNLTEAPQDALEKALVIQNDRLIQRVIAEKVFDNTEGTDVELYAI